MKKKNFRIVVVFLLFAILFMPFSEITTAAATKKVAKPGQVKGLKKVSDTCKWDGHRNVNSVKIKFNKVKGASGYQILVYRTNKMPGGLTPLIYAYNTKKTTYTIKNLDPNLKLTVKVRAYVKGRNGKIIYGKTKAIKFKTNGKESGCYYSCDSCGAVMPGNSYRIEEHGKSAWETLGELHAGGTFYWK